MRDYQDHSQEGGAIKVMQTQVSAEKKSAPTKSLGPAGDLSSRLLSAATLHKLFEVNPALARASLIHLQRQYGNLYVQRVAELARKNEADADADAAPPDVQQAIERNRGGGQPVDNAVQSQMGQAFNADFSGVRVHTNSEADGLNRALQARAFTTGQDVFFRQGEYNPGSSSGRQLLAHELTHVVQQNPDKLQRKTEQGEGGGCACGGAGAVNRSLQPKLTVGRPGDFYEQEADRMAQALPAWEQRYGHDTTTGMQRATADEETEKEAAKLMGKPLEGTLLRQMEEEKKEETPIHAKGMEGGIQRQGEGEEPGQRPLLRVGSSGPIVVEAQQALNGAGAAPVLKNDGIFGQLTRHAVVDFQSATGLKADGVVGPRTYEALGIRGRAPTGGAGPAEPARCTYQPGEREKSKSGTGEVDPFTGGPTDGENVLLYNFIPGDHTARSEHLTFLKDMVTRLRLESTEPHAKIVVLDGYTDCVDTEAKNSAIRQGRANDIYQNLLVMKALPDNILSQGAAGTGELFGTDADAYQRSRNRSVILRTKRAPPPKEEPPKREPPPGKKCDPATDIPSDEWKLVAVGASEVVLGIGRIKIFMQLRNLTSGCCYGAEFEGWAAGVAGGVTVSVPPSWTFFQTPLKKVRPKELEGKASVTSGSVEADVVGYELAYINLHQDNVPTWIDIGGLEAGPGLPIGLYLSEGRFIVNRECIIPIPETE